MKPLLLIMLLLSSGWTYAEEAKESKEEWQNTTLSDEVIQKIQHAEYNYKKCMSDAMRKPEISNLDSRKGTDTVANECEPVLAETHKAYTDAGVPKVIADRQLKSLRIKTTRNVLQELMYNEAAKKSGQLNQTQQAGHE